MHPTIYFLYSNSNFTRVRDSKIQILECIYKKVEYHFLAMNLPYVRENQHRYEEPTFDLY